MFHYDIRILNCVFNRVGCSVVSETEREVTEVTETTLIVIGTQRSKILQPSQIKGHKSTTVTASIQ